MPSRQMQRATRSPQPRVRDAKASKAKILDAARAVFAENGYAGGSMREIARRAGVTHGLVTRHFGSKEALLIAALPGVRELGAALRGPKQTLPQRTVAAFMQQIDLSGGESTIVALIRSAAAPGQDASTPLYRELERQANDAYQEVLGKGHEQTIEMLRSFLIGVAFNRYVAPTTAIEAMSPDQLAEHLLPIVTAILLPALSDADTPATNPPPSN